MDLGKLTKEELLKLIDSMPEEVVDEAKANLELPPSQIEQLSIELIHVMLCNKKEDCAFMLEMMMDARWDQEDHIEWRENTKKVLDDYELSYEEIYDNYDLILQLIKILKDRPIAFDLIRMIKDCDEQSGFVSKPSHKMKSMGEE